MADTSEGSASVAKQFNESTAYLASGTSLSIFLLIAHMSSCLFLRLKVGKYIDFTAIFTVIIFTIYFLLVVCNWVAYTILCIKDEVGD